MVYITQNKLHIEIETTSPHEELHFICKDLLLLLAHSKLDCFSNDPKATVYQLLQEMIPDISQLQKGM